MHVQLIDPSPPSTHVAPQPYPAARSTKITLRWDSITVTTVAGILGFAVGIAVATPIIARAVVNEDHGLPACTDAIADAGGMCEGPILTAGVPDVTLPECAAEDATNCYWDAARMGNNEGRSFINFDGRYFYEEDSE